jgi:nitrite reductase (NADH) large subunit
MQTSHPDVFAAGDVAEHNGIIYGIWPPAQFQGAIAGMNAAGQTVEFAGIPRSNTLKVLGYDLFSIGQINPASAEDQVIDAEWDNQYAGYIFHVNQMVGSILMGDISLSNKVKAAIENQVDFSSVLNQKPGAKDIMRFLVD